MFRHFVCPLCHKFLVSIFHGLALCLFLQSFFFLILRVSDHIMAIVVLLQFFKQQSLLRKAMRCCGWPPICCCTEWDAASFNISTCTTDQVTKLNPTHVLCNCEQKRIVCFSLLWQAFGVNLAIYFCCSLQKQLLFTFETFFVHF